MAQITLSAYQNQLDDALLDEQFDETIAHTRHILKSYPKNLRAYQQLSDALIGAQRWNEAAQVLRRMLAAQPQNFKTHSLLARAYRQLGDTERAIQHAQRAFDQKPAHQDTIDLLRSLYQESRGQSIERITLTASALAQQQIRANNLRDALDAINQALEGSPNRIDLHILRARTLWLDGQRIAAAEDAEEILATLPHAITANRIMAELWLSEQRPSDAAPYLKRIEALDPFLAHQLANSQSPPDDLLTLEKLDYDSATDSPSPIDNPDLKPATNQSTATADLDDLLEEEEIEKLFAELITEEPAPAPDDDQDQSAPYTDDDQSHLDDAARILEQLEYSEDEEDDSSWIASIQQASLEQSESDAGQYIEDGDRDVLLPPETEDEPVGAPWLSAAMRELMTNPEAGDDLDLFADDEQVQNLLKQTADTQPLDLDDIQSWIELDEEPIEEPTADDIDLDALDIHPAEPIADADEHNRLSAELIDAWGAQLEDDEDEDDDPYIDWLSEEIPEQDAIPTDSPPAVEEIPDPDTHPADSPDETARAWGLKDQEQLADFVEDEVRLADAEANPSWLNAMVPGLDRDGDIQPENDKAFAKPSARHGREFAWLTDIVEEETGEMEALPDPAPPTETLFFRFSHPPAWLASLKIGNGGIGIQSAPVEAVAALTVVDSLDDLDLDELSFESSFDFDAPTEKIDAVSPDDSTEIDLSHLEWDDYFDFDSPTEKTIAITLDDEETDITYQELDVDDEDFDFDTPTEKLPAITLKEELDPLEFEDVGLNDSDRQRSSAAT